MKFSVFVALLSAFALVACDVDEPPQRTPPAARYPVKTARQYPPQPQPFQDSAAPREIVTTPPPEVTSSEPQSAPAAPPTAKGDYPYGVPVPGKPGFVRSPYSPDKMTDVRGYAPGTEVKDPYTQKIFLVP
ncbi:MAG: hypothetical protein ACR2ID_02275 [Chthoniobacterales bacterium]